MSFLNKISKNKQTSYSSEYWLFLIIVVFINYQRGEMGVRLVNNFVVFPKAGLLISVFKWGEQWQRLCHHTRGITQSRSASAEWCNVSQYILGGRLITVMPEEIYTPRRPTMTPIKAGNVFTSQGIGQSKSLCHVLFCINTHCQPYNHSRGVRLPVNINV